MIRTLAQRARRNLHGHYWTYAGYVRAHVAPPEPIGDEPVSILAEDPALGPVPLTARFRDEPASDTCVLLLHGLGGDLESRYVKLAALAARRTGKATLRLGFRGSDLRGADIYHAGLTDDVRAALASPELARFSRVELVGYSMGGHVALSYGALASEASGGFDPRVRAIAAVCAPLDLALGVRAIQRADRRLYQFHVLGSLKAAYRAVEARAREAGRALAWARAPQPSSTVDRARTIRDWDELVVCPRYGFRDPDHYYAVASAGPRLARIEVPTLLAVAEADPMVPLSSLGPWLERTSSAVTTWRFARGGHGSFPTGLRRAEASVEDEIAAWLAER